VHNTAGAMAMGHPVTRGWAARSVPLTPVAKTCTGLGFQPFRPDGPSIATSMPDGALNVCFLFWFQTPPVTHFLFCFVFPLRCSSVFFFLSVLCFRHVLNSCS
jgi:hypothetical protein